MAKIDAGREPFLFGPQNAFNAPMWPSLSTFKGHINQKMWPSKADLWNIYGRRAEIIENPWSQARCYLPACYCTARSTYKTFSHLGLIMWMWCKDLAKLDFENSCFNILQALEKALSLSEREQEQFKLSHLFFKKSLNLEHWRAMLLKINHFFWSKHLIDVWVWHWRWSSTHNAIWYFDKALGRKLVVRFEKIVWNIQT